MATPEGFFRLIKTCVVERAGKELIPDHFDPELAYSDEENIQYGRYISELRSQIVVYLNYLKIDLDKKEDFKVKPESDLCNLVLEFTRYAYGLALKNKGLISSVLNNLNKGSCTEEDLVDLYQQGWEGLFKAALIYNPDDERLSLISPHKFSYIAVPYIKGTMQRHIINMGTVRVPQNTSSDLNNFGKTWQTLTQWFSRDAMDQEVLAFMILKNKLQREPSADELQVYMDKLKKREEEKANNSFDRLRSRMNRARNARGIGSLSDERSVNFRDAEGEWTIGDFGERGDDFTGTLIDHESGSPEDMVNKKMLKEEIALSLTLLTDREKEILVLRYGLNGELDHTLKEIGQLFHLTSERVRQIQDKALRKLRVPSQQKKRLRDYL